MPVIQITALPQPDNVDLPEVMKRISTSVANVLRVPAHSVWCTWDTLQPGYYIEGETAASEQPHTTHPPIVRLIQFEGRSDELIEQVLSTISSSLCDALAIEQGNAFIYYVEALSGRVYSGGAIRRTTR